MPPVAADPGLAGQPALTPQEELRVFRNLVSSLVGDAAQALGELEMWCQDAKQIEQCYLVRHYLDYLRRLCNGKA
jgi:hypothetical protein